MGVYLIEAVASCAVPAPEQPIEHALAAHGFRVASKRRFDARTAGATKPYTVRWSRRRLPRTSPFLWVTDRETGLNPDWWTTLSGILDGFVLGYEKWDSRDLHRIVWNLSGKLLEDRTYAPDRSAGIMDARTVWGEHVARLAGVHASAVDEAAVVEGEDWWLEPCDPQPAPPRCAGGRALLANVSESAFAETAAAGLNGWRWRPWTGMLDLPAIDLWRPAGFDTACVKQWAEKFDCIAVTWDVDSTEWPWSEFYGADRVYEGIVRDPAALADKVRMALTAVGEEPLGIGGRGLEGWRGA